MLCVLRLEKVIKLYERGIRADLDAVAFVISIEQPNEPTIVIPDIDGIMSFIEQDVIVSNALNSNISAEKVILYFSQGSILAEATPRGDRVDVKFTCGDVLIMDGIMAYPSYDSFEKVLGGVMKYFEENKELYLKERQV